MARIVLQYTGCIAEMRDELYCKTELYCEVQWQETRLPVSQDRQLCRETALGAGWACAGRTAGAGGRAWGARAGAAGNWARGRNGRTSAAGVRSRQQQAQQARGARGAGGLVPGRAAWARGLATGCALDALGLFSIRIDSVLFTSQFLDIVREPGS